MAKPRRTRGGGPKVYADLCENCEPMVRSSSTSKLSQGTLKSDAASKERKDNLENLDVDERRVLLAITVEIEDGCVEHIQLKEGDSAEAVAMKFCRDHDLPEQFVAPLTEHIVSNIISISKEDSDIVFHSQEQPISDDENSTVNGGGGPYSPGMQGSDAPQPRSESRAETSALIARRERRSPTNPPLMASQKINRQPPDARHYCDHNMTPPWPKPKRKIRRKRGRKKVSDRLIAPTITSMAKSGALERDPPRTPRLNRPLSEPAKAVYMRLYTEWIRHDHHIQDEVKRQKAIYQETVVRRRMGLSKNSSRLTRMRGKIAKQYKNYGELLYAEGLTMRQNHLKAVSDKAKHDEAKEMAELTLRPKISKRAKNIKRGHGQVWSRLQNDDKPKQDQLQELRQEVWEAKLMECTFKPRINQWRYDGPEQPGDHDYSNRFEQLFLDAESRRRRRAEYMEWYPEGVTFTPCINKGMPYWASMEEEWHLEGSVYRRLLENATRLIEKKEMQEKQAHRPVDPRTGRPLYKPHTGRKPLNERNPVHLPIGEYLYKMKFNFDDKIKSLVERDIRKKKEQAECQYVGPKSQRLLKRLKERGYQQIFDILDDDKDGVVDLATANVDRLNNDVIEDLTRLMDSIEGDDKKLKREDFLKRMLAAEVVFIISCI